MLYDSSGAPIGFNTPFGPNGPAFQARAKALIYDGTGLYVEVSSVSNTDNLPLEVSVNAFDLGGPSGLPEPSTWTMMLLGMAAVGFAVCRRARPARAVAKRPLRPI